MLFNSYPFLFLFLPVTLGVFFWLGRFNRRLAAAWLTATSLAFYSFWNPAYLILLVLSIFFNYSVGVELTYAHDREERYRVTRLLWFGVGVDLLALAYFKYAGFFVSNLNGLTGWQLSLGEIVLPLGISFFTFTQIAFLVDASRGLARELNFIHYGLFVTYFPHLIAGPVLHHKEMMPQFAHPDTYRVNYENLAVGSAIFAIGLFKKVVLADGIAVYVSAGFTEAANGQAIGFFDAWGSALSYTFQLYFDFSGYSDMAIGLSRLFGVRLPLNFNSPYKSDNIVEFWRRWHMTLSRFLRDYLYIPLGGNRLGPFRRYLNLFITMFLGGLWHGAGWTFVIWGSLHGIYLIINHAWQNVAAMTGRRIALGRMGGTLVTFMAVVAGWVFFRSETIGGAFAMLKGMAGFNGISVPAYVLALHPDVERWLGILGVTATLGGGSRFVWTYAWILGLGLIAFFAPNTQEILPVIEAPMGKPESGQTAGPLRQAAIWSPTPIWAVALGIVTALGILAMNQVSEFLYFQF
jgi:D-alanyl-lipoteichoic acid acyltransferase DltB (MBOAT superfamily)